MNTASFPFGLVLILLVADAALAVLARLAKLSAPTIARKAFLTENEKCVLGFLEAALPDHRVMAQVAMGALLTTTESDRSKASSARNRFSQKIVDYAIVTRDTAEVVALVELDDRTHRVVKDVERDAMTAAAGYCTIRIPGRPRPTAQSVREAVAHLARSSLAIAQPLESRMTARI